jgi:hypothetical protein
MRTQSHGINGIQPGREPIWQVASPESQGVRADLLVAGEELVNAEMAGRLCYIVVKNGFLIHETYRRGHTEVVASPRVLNDQVTLCRAVRRGCAAGLGLP